MDNLTASQRKLIVVFLVLMVAFAIPMFALSALQ